MSAATRAVLGLFRNGLSRAGEEPCSPTGHAWWGSPGASPVSLPAVTRTEICLFFEDNGFASSGDSLLVFLACTYRTSCPAGWSTHAPSMARLCRAPCCCCDKYLPIQQPEVLLPGFSVCVLLRHLAVCTSDTLIVPSPPGWTYCSLKIDFGLFVFITCSRTRWGKVQALPSLCGGLQMSLAHVLHSVSSLCQYANSLL